MSLPSQTIPYPADWPSDLHYPNPFNLVEATSGVSPQGVKGWAAKLVYQGDPQSAADLLTTFLTSKSWQPTERTVLDSSDYLLLFRKGDRQHTGTIVIDAEIQRPGYVKIIATIFE